MVDMAGGPDDDGLHSEQFTELTAPDLPASAAWLWNFSGRTKE